MSLPTPATASLEIRMSSRGRLEAYWKGDRLPAIEVEISHTRGERAEVRLVFVGNQVSLSTQPDNEQDASK